MKPALVAFATRHGHTKYNYEYTEWGALDRFIDGLQADVSPHALLSSR
mgnify:CR=1 FL=1